MEVSMLEITRVLVWGVILLTKLTHSQPQPGTCTQPNICTCTGEWECTTGGEGDERNEVSINVVIILATFLSIAVVIIAMLITVIVFQRIRNKKGRSSTASPDEEVNTQENAAYRLLTDVDPTKSSSYRVIHRDAPKDDDTIYENPSPSNPNQYTDDESIYENTTSTNYY